MICDDGAGQLSRSAASTLHETLEVVERTTGLDVQVLLARGATDAGRNGATAPAE